MYHKMRVCLAGTPAQTTKRTPVLAGRKVRLHRKILTWIFGPEENLMILIPGKTIQDIKIKEERDEPC